MISIVYENSCFNFYVEYIFHHKTIVFESDLLGNCNIFSFNFVHYNHFACRDFFIIYKVVKYRKILLIYNVCFIFSLVKI